MKPDPARLQAAQAILASLLDTKPADRDAALEHLCAGDHELQALVRRLLAHIADVDAADDVDRFPGRGALWREACSELSELAVLQSPQPLFGDYRVVRRLGFGGSAEVFLGERNDGEVRRQVAIKLLTADVGDAVAIERFVQEQQILAALSHPHIGRLFDIGRTPQGNPYFIMEYVRGEPIDRYCDAHALGIRERLALFVTVAGAVAHAHSALVIHRDIKPGNVLVDAEGNPKLVDFGIAKLLPAGGGHTPLTAAGLSPGTIGYASPEQLAGDPTGVASDVYQLGVLLFELLVGQRPHAARGLTNREMLALLRETPPTPPSTRLQRLHAEGREFAETIAARRRSTARRLLRELHGDLDRIVAHALDPDPALRYGSVVQFADDIENFLAGRPVAARGHGALYVLSRFVRRHALSTAIVVVLFVGLVVFSVAVGILALRLEQARARAELQNSVSEQVVTFLVDTFRELEPEKAASRNSVVVTALDRAAAAPTERFGNDPATRARLQLLLGGAYGRLQRYDNAAAAYRAALEQARHLAGIDAAQVEAQARLGIAMTDITLRQMPSARAEIDRVLAMTHGVSELGAQHAQALRSLATWHSFQGDSAAAITANRQAVVAIEALKGAGHVDAIGAAFSEMKYLVDDEWHTAPARLAKSIALGEELVTRASRALGPEQPLTLQIRLVHNRHLAFHGHLQRSLADHAHVLPVAERVLGLHDLYVLNSRRVAAITLARAGRTGEAATAMTGVVARVRERYSARHELFRWTMFDYAACLAAAGRHDEAIAAFLESRVDMKELRREPLLAALATDPALAAGLPPESSGQHE
ncbi:MAG: hypothetical protein AMXMBFR59_23440 [Rhodanobacteraceae bacterium]